MQLFTHASVAHAVFWEWLASHVVSVHDVRLQKCFSIAFHTILARRGLHQQRVDMRAHCLGTWLCSYILRVLMAGMRARVYCFALPTGHDMQRCCDSGTIVVPPKQKVQLVWWHLMVNTGSWLRPKGKS
jgi:hypothetical protein